MRTHAERFIRRDLRHLLPGAFDSDGEFDWNLLCGGADRTGASRLDTQFWTANVDPSDRYVQSLPGTDHLRLRADESGFENLYLAGDWTNSGINAGCIEAAVLSGLRAANAVMGRSLDADLVGSNMDVGERPGPSTSSPGRRTR